MNLSNEQWIFLQDVAKLIIYAKNAGYKLTGGELYRTSYQQREYLRTGKSKTLRSKHLRRLAIDLNIFINGKLTYEPNDIRLLGEYWERLNSKNVWGGSWGWDAGHFERNV